MPCACNFMLHQKMISLFRDKYSLYRFFFYLLLLSPILGEEAWAAIPGGTVGNRFRKYRITVVAIQYFSFNRWGGIETFRHLMRVSIQMTPCFWKYFTCYNNNYGESSFFGNSSRIYEFGNKLFTTTFNLVFNKKNLQY